MLYNIQNQFLVMVGNGKAKSIWLSTVGNGAPDLMDVSLIQQGFSYGLMTLDSVPKKAGGIAVDEWTEQTLN